MMHEISYIWSMLFISVAVASITTTMVLGLRDATAKGALRTIVTAIANRAAKANLGKMWFAITCFAILLWSAIINCIIWVWR